MMRGVSRTDGMRRRCANRSRNLIDVGVDEVERHLCVSALRGDHASDQQRGRDATQCHTISSHGV